MTPIEAQVSQARPRKVIEYTCPDGETVMFFLWPWRDTEKSVIIPESPIRDILKPP